MLYEVEQETAKPGMLMLMPPQWQVLLLITVIYICSLVEIGFIAINLLMSIKSYTVFEAEIIFSDGLLGYIAMKTFLDSTFPH